MIRISKKYLKKIIAEETKKVYEAHDEGDPSLTHSGEDFTGHKGNISKTHAGRDYMSDDDLYDHSKPCPDGWKDADCLVNKINDIVVDNLKDIVGGHDIGDDKIEKIISDLVFAIEEPLLDLALEVGNADSAGQLGSEEDLMEEEDDSFSKAGEEIEKKGTEGVFTKKAKDAGMGVQAFAKKVLAKGSDYSTKTKRQAAFAKGAETVARNRKKKK